MQMTKWNTVTANRLDEQTTMKDFQRQHSRPEKMVCFSFSLFYESIQLYQ